jgi:hypothetical protein
MACAPRLPFSLYAGRQEQSMRASTSVLSRYAKRLFTKALATAPLRRADHRPRRRASWPIYAAAEVLEERALLSGPSLASAVSIGNATGSSVAFNVAADSAGNSYVTGSFSGTVDFDPGATHTGDTDILTARGSGDAFVAKYAADSSLVWVPRMGGDVQGSGGVTDVGRKIAIDGSGNVYVAGSFKGSADFGSTTLSTSATPGDQDGFVVKLDAGGTIQWANRWGIAGSGNGADDTGNGVGVDSSGNVYAMGYRLGSGGGFDILKFTANGSAVWSESIAAAPGFSSSDFTADGSGNVFVAGNFQGTVDFDPSSKTHDVSAGPSVSGFVEKLNTNGKFQWVSPFVGQTVGSTSGYSGAYSVALDASGNVIVGGYYQNTVDFDPGRGTTTLSPVGGGFIAKLNGSGGLVWARALESGTASGGSVNELAVDTAGNIYATGSFSGTIDLDPGAGVDSHTSNGGGDIYVVKLDGAGNFGWGETFGGPGGDIGFGIAVDASGTVHVVGSYSQSVDFDPDPFATYYLTTPGTYSNAYLVRLRQG